MPSHSPVQRLTTHKRYRTAIIGTGICGVSVARRLGELRPTEHPFWKHPGVYVTPHAAGPTKDISAINQIVGNIGKIEQGEDPHPVWNWQLGY